MTNDKLKQLDGKLVIIFGQAKSMFDTKYQDRYSIGLSCTHRSIAEQQRLYAQGRTTPGNIVTKVDGINKLSKHNYVPSKAFDFFIVDEETKKALWNEIDLYIEFAELAKIIAKEKGFQISCGSDWTSFKDYPHIEIV